MKNLGFIWLILFTLNVNAQEILIVNDNDVLPQNTDSILVAMAETIYGTYDFWDIPDSAGIGPDAAFMDDYDLVIWYCSTDGGGLNLWDGSPDGNTEIIEYILTEKPLWIIGLDFLFEIYAAAPDVVTTGTFAYDYIGIESYDFQSYGDDGSTGVPQVDTILGAPSIFPDSLIWNYPTQWWVDGVTPRTGVLPIYEMGPPSYALAGEITMIHNTEDLSNVMTTFFDPALIKGVTATANFLEAGITYLLPADLGDNTSFQKELNIFPNPFSSELKINVFEFSNYSITDLNGRILNAGVLKSGLNSIDLNELGAGIYILNIVNVAGLPEQVLIQKI